MAGKIHTDSEALYAIRSAITKFAGEIQESKNDFSQCFEQMNCQIDGHIKHLRSLTEALYEDKRSAEDEIVACEEKKADAERKKNSNRSGSTDTFVCRNEACGSRMMLKVMGDTAPCKSCGGTMHRVFTNGEYNRYNTEAFQAEERINQLRIKLAEIERKIKSNEDTINDVSSEYLLFRSHQDSILSLLTFSSGEDPETAASFIERALSSLGDYQAVNFGAVGSSSEDEVQKKNIGNNTAPKQDDSESITLQELLAKERLTEKDREALRNAIINGTVGEYEIRTIGARVRAKYEQFLQKRREDFEYIQSKKRELAILFNNASSDEERHQVAIETIFLKEKETQYREKYGNSSVIKKVLETYRSIGPKENDPGQKYEKGLFVSSQSVIDAIDSIREYIPTDWVEKSNGVPIVTKHVNRGYFNVKDGKPTIALSTAGSGMQRCAFHEMGHFFEHLYPEIRKLEYQFYNRRTAGEELRWLGAGYSRSEVTRYDNFVEPYMGKDYGNTETSGYEIFSMGMESIFANSYDLSRDTEYQDLMLGILASV